MKAIVRGACYVTLALVIVVAIYGGAAFLAADLFGRGNVFLGAVIACSLLVPVLVLAALSFLAIAERPSSDEGKAASAE